MESTAPRVVTKPVYDAPTSLNGSQPESSFFGKITSFFRRAYTAVKNVAVRAYNAVKGAITGVVDRLPAAVRRLGKPFVLSPLVIPPVWNLIGKAATWMWNHGPRQINNLLHRYIREPLQRWVNSKTDNSALRLVPMALEGIIYGVAHSVLKRMGPWGMVASTALILVTSDLLKFTSDFTDDNPFGQTVMAGVSLGTIATMFVAALFGKNWSVGQAAHLLVLRVAPIGGYLQQVWFDMTTPVESEPKTEKTEETVEVSNEEMGQRVADELRKDPANKVTLVQSKKNLNPKGRREVWLVQGHDVDVDAIKGFYWRDGIGYDADNQPVAVDLRGDLTRATRDRRRAQFTDEWALAHPASA